MLFGLQRIFFSIAVAKYFYRLRLDFPGLALPDRCHQLSGYSQGSACSKPAQQGLIILTQCCYDLYILIGAAIIQGNELVVAKSTHPSHYRYRSPFLARLQQVLDLNPLIEHNTLVLLPRLPQQAAKIQTESAPSSPRQGL